MAMTYCGYDAQKIVDKMKADGLKLRAGRWKSENCLCAVSAMLHYIGKDVNECGRNDCGNYDRVLIASELSLDSVDDIVYAFDDFSGDDESGDAYKFGAEIRRLAIEAGIFVTD